MELLALANCGIGCGARGRRSVVSGSEKHAQIFLREFSNSRVLSTCINSREYHSKRTSNPSAGRPFLVQQVAFPAQGETISGGILPKAKITALGCYTPPRVLTNHDFSKMVETSDKWIVERPESVNATLQTRMSRRLTWRWKRPKIAACELRAATLANWTQSLFVRVTPECSFPAPLPGAGRLGAQGSVGVST